MSMTPLQTIIVKRHQTQNGVMLSGYCSAKSMQPKKVRMFLDTADFTLEHVKMTATLVGQMLGWGGEYVIGCLSEDSWVFTNKHNSPTEFFLDR